MVNPYCFHKTKEIINIVSKYNFVNIFDTITMRDLMQEVCLPI